MQVLCTYHKTLSNICTFFVLKIGVIYLHNKRRYVYLSVCLSVADEGRTAGSIKIKLGMRTHVDPGSVLVKVKVTWRHLANANKNPYRGPQGPREFERKVR